MSYLRMIQLFIVGFISFFATGVDDTVAYAPLMKNKRQKMIVSSGIILATILCLVIAVFLSGLIRQLPYSNYIGGIGLVLLGFWIISGKGIEPKPTLLKLTTHPNDFSENETVGGLKLFFLGFSTFFLTGLDDTIAYSFLLTTQAALIGITAGVMVATFVDLLIVFFLADRMKKLPHAREVGGSALVLLGILIALRLL